MDECVFCSFDKDIRQENHHAIACYDGFPVSTGHMLVIPRRHVASIFELSLFELQDLIKLIRYCHSILKEEHNPDGFNIGINEGEAAGQTVPHLHVHIIPRYRGDQDDPRGGVRLIFPEKARYWEEKEEITAVYCPSCISFMEECTPEVEDYSLPCKHFKPKYES